MYSEIGEKLRYGLFHNKYPFHRCPAYGDIGIAQAQPKKYKTYALSVLEKQRDTLMIAQASEYVDRLVDDLDAAIETLKNKEP
jgi:hypothetical protein